ENFIVARGLERFQLFDNFPSNPGYYLLVTLSFFLVMLILSLKEKRYWKTLALYVGLTGLTGILIWTQSRASWLAFFAASLFMVVASVGQRGTKHPARLAVLLVILLAAALAISFLFLPTIVKVGAILRFFPQIDASFYHLSIFGGTPGGTVEALRANNLAPS